jgi:hypothetical protein
MTTEQALREMETGHGPVIGEGRTSREARDILYRARDERGKVLVVLPDGDRRHLWPRHDGSGWYVRTGKRGLSRLSLLRYRRTKILDVVIWEFFAAPR